MEIENQDKRNLEGYVRLLQDIFSLPRQTYGIVPLETARRLSRLRSIQPEEYPAVADAIDEAMLRLAKSGGPLVQRAFNALKLRYALNEPNSWNHTYAEIATRLPRYSNDRSLGPIGLGVSPNRARELTYRGFRALRRYGREDGIYGFGGSRE